MAALPPLTHHEILSLVAPFSRRGFQSDLAASDRAARRLVLRRRPQPASPTTLVEPQEHLELEPAGAGRLRLVRHLAWADGLAATLEAEGAEAEALLSRIEAVPVGRHRADGPGWSLAASFRAAASGLALRHAQARLNSLHLDMKLTGVAGYPADLELRGAGPGAPRSLPEDLLAVLGTSWSPLTTVRRGWLATLRLRGEEPRRSQAAEAGLHQAVAHLARTLAEPPARFHERHRAARWAVAARTALPWAIGALVVAAALWAQRQGPGAQPVLALLANIAPPLLLAVVFMRREMLRLACPRRPRPPPPDAWPVRPDRTTPSMTDAAGPPPSTTEARTAP